MKEYKSMLVGALLCVSFLLVQAYAATDKHNEVTIVIPAKVLQGFINEVLPVEITPKKKVSGVLWIQSIEGLRLGLDKLWFTVTIHGDNIAYKGKIGGLPADLRFGALESTLNCEASIRYDTKKGLLYVRPKVVEEGKKGDILWLLLVSILSEGEYPVEVQKLKPIAARFSDKTVEIDMDISNIYTTNDRLFIALQPTVKATQLARNNG
ncbi:MAG: hypothetical protein DRG87_07590 [Deltaproteobacteria bacterium]|nr:hypothetical protein [Deltaproteobacteria bacterium]RLB29235.1 MAG: hypothetical protein DRG87_07590 [Deltaproteobacteria bacterium]